MNKTWKLAKWRLCYKNNLLQSIFRYLVDFGPDWWLNDIRDIKNDNCIYYHLSKHYLCHNKVLPLCGFSTFTLIYSNFVTIIYNIICIFSTFYTFLLKNCVSNVVNVLILTGENQLFSCFHSGQHSVELRHSVCYFVYYSEISKIKQKVGKMGVS